MEDQKSGFFTTLAERCEKIQSSLCIGLDPDPRRIPRHLGNGPEAIYKFCVEIIEATADSAAAFKPNLAFFESLGVEGWHVLAQALQAVPKEVPVILDAKRGDIGSTAQHYARAIFDCLRGDAVTVNPYMGMDSVEPFLEHEERGVYVLCLTSNPGAADFQMYQDLYLRIARKVKQWNTRGNCGMVVGATKPQFLTSILTVAPDIPLLIPGLGAQGGDLAAIMTAAPGLARHHLLFNVSRSIIYAADDNSFGRQARIAARYYREMINKEREKTMKAGEKLMKQDEGTNLSQQTGPTGAPAPDQASSTLPKSPEWNLFHWFWSFLFRQFGRFWLRLETVHLERVPLQGPVMVLSTHTSFLDPPMVGSNLPRQAHYLAREGIINAPLVGWLTRNLNAHPIRRGASDREAIRLCRSILREGKPLVFFPEGTRSLDGRLGPLQRGFAMILDGLPGVPYIPVVAQDTYRSLPRGKIFPRPSKVKLVFGYPATLPERKEGESTRNYYDRCAQDLERRFRELGAK